MCVDPVTAIGMGLSVASSAIQASANSQYVNAQNKANRDAYEISKAARQAELARQKAFETEANDNWQNTLNRVSRDEYDQGAQEAETAFLDQFANMSAAVSDGQMLSGQNTASDAVRSEIAARTSKAASEARDRVKALAALTSYGTVGQGRAQDISSGADFLGTLNGLRRGSLAVSNQEQSISPASVTKGSTILGDVLGGVGGLVTQRGAYNAAKGGNIVG